MELYNKLAKYADITYSNKNYQKEVEFILQIFNKYDLKPKLIYDIGCGSGNHSKILLKRGYHVIGVDLNQGMINLAKKNVPKLKVLKQDMRKLKLSKKGDCIITMFNAINHFSSYADFEMMLNSYYQSLNRGGLVIFDTMFTQEGWINKYHGAKTYLTENFLLAKVDHSLRLGKNKGFIHQIYVVIKGKTPAKFYQHHYENLIYDFNRMIKIIKTVGFSVKVFYNFSLTERRNEPCTKVFVLQKK